jgi:hypothetical protein
MWFVLALPDRVRDELRYGGSFRGLPRQHSREDSPNRSLFIELFENISMTGYVNAISPMTAFLEEKLVTG